MITNLRMIAKIAYVVIGITILYFGNIAAFKEIQNPTNDKVKTVVSIVTGSVDLLVLGYIFYWAFFM